MVISSDIVQGIHALSRLHVVIPLIQELSVTEIFKAILNVYMYRATLGEENVKKISWLQGYIVAIIIGAAGSITMSLIRGAPIDLWNQTDFLTIYGILYWMFFYNPHIFNTVHYVFTKYPHVKLVLIGLSGINKGYALIRFGVEKENTLIAKVVSGVLVSCGGSLWLELFGLDKVDWKFSTPRQFLAPSTAVKASLSTISCYFILSSFIDDLDEAHAIGSVIHALFLVHNAHRNIVCDHNNKEKKEKDDNNKVKKVQ